MCTVQVQRLLVLDATARLGAAEAGGYEPLTSHAYFAGANPPAALPLLERATASVERTGLCLDAGVDWEGLHLQEAPTPTYLYPPVTPLQESLSKLQLKDDELDQAIRPLLQEGKSVVGHALSARLAENAYGCRRKGRQGRHDPQVQRDFLRKNTQAGTGPPSGHGLSIAHKHATHQSHRLRLTAPVCARGTHVRCSPCRSLVQEAAACWPRIASPVRAGRARASPRGFGSSAALRC